jgi:hypothetical protein
LLLLLLRLHQLLLLLLLPHLLLVPLLLLLVMVLLPHLLLLAVLLLLLLLQLQPLIFQLPFLLLLILEMSKTIEQCLKMAQSSTSFQVGKVEIGVLAHTAVSLKLESSSIHIKLFLRIAVGVYQCRSCVCLCFELLCLPLNMFPIHCRSYE